MKADAQTLDVAIIGAGVAGLTAAYRLDDLHCAVFEAAGEIGGRTKLVAIDGIRAPTGAGVVYMGTESHALCDELGLSYSPAAPETYSCHYRGRTIVARDNAELVARLDMSPAARTELLEVLDRICSEYRQYSSHGLSAASEQLRDIPFSEYIGRLQPEAADFLGKLVFCHCMATPEELAAQYALRYLSAKLTRDATHMSYVDSGGMQDIAFALGGRITSPIRLNHSVEAVRKIEGGYRLRVNARGEAQDIEARQVLMAVEGPEVSRLAPWLPAWKLDALANVESVAALIVTMVLETPEDAPWRDVFFMPTLDCAFNYIANCRISPAREGERRTAWQVGAWKDRARTSMACGDQAILARWMPDIERVFPGAEAHLRGTYVQRWPAGFAIAKADRANLVEPIVRPIEGLHFAGDYASPSAGTHGAIGSAQLAAQRIRDSLARAGS